MNTLNSVSKNSGAKHLFHSGFAGGQTFLKGLPCLFFEGMGGAVSYLESAMCRYFAPIIQATPCLARSAGAASSSTIAMR